VVEYYPVTAQRPADDGSLEVDLEVASEEWLRTLVFRLAPHAVVLAPTDYARSFTAAARATLSLYEGGGVG
jgi:proteasome accessory factor C